MKKELNLYLVYVLDLSRDEKHTHVVVASNEVEAEEIVFTEYDFEEGEETCIDIALIDKVVGPGNKQYEIIVKTETKVK